MPRIQLLDGDLANQIAAGEVVERPASVVKELVENALDSGATRIQVDIESGGVELVRVTDDGGGMDRDDARLAFERHATSKLRAFDDLMNLETFGFRGEALPSIASVSKLTLRTRTADDAEGTEITLDGGGVPRVRPTGHAPGTSVEVRDLFFNVPARRKFLKAAAAESALVGEVVLMAALSRPEVTFVLTRDGRPAREYLRAGSRNERVRQVTSEERLETCEATRGALQLEAHLAPPERARTGAVALHLLVNGRPVKDRQLARAVAQAFGSVLEPGRYPAGAVYIDIPPALVDVNVHPQKAEVRFADARGVYDAVTRELHHLLAKSFSLPGGPYYRAAGNGALASRFGAPGPVGGASPLGPPPSTPWKFTAEVASPAQPLPPTPLAPLFPPGPSLKPQPSGAAAQVAAPWETAAPVAGGVTGAAPQANAAKEPYPAPAHAAPMEIAQSTLFGRDRFYAGLTFVAQVRRMFLACEGHDALYLLDQHAAAERVAFHRLKVAYAAREVPVQRLLVPDVVELAATEVASLEEHGDAVAALGLEVRAVGPAAIAVHGVPQLLGRASPERLVRDVVAELGRHATRPFGDAADRVLATMACHGSLRAGDRVSHDEAVSLLAALDDVDFAGHCPHGRPVVTRLAWGELERAVGRP